MKKILAVVSLLLVLSFAGCADTESIATSWKGLSRKAGATIIATRHPRPAFASIWPSYPKAGVIESFSACYKYGNQLIEAGDIQDPAAAISGDLMAFLADRIKVVPQPGELPVASGKAGESIAAAAGKADLVLDVRTTEWRCDYLDFKPTEYMVQYRVQFRLIDVKRRWIIAEGTFGWSTPDKASHPTYDELAANNGALLRQQLEEARKAATEAFKIRLQKGHD